MASPPVALVECPMELNSSYTCQTPYPNCTSTYGFQFSALYTISEKIYNACPTDWRIFDQKTPFLSEAGYEQISGSSWTPYPGGDIWARLTTWKFPLLQLVAIFPRPPLNFKVEAFVIFHLLGNPVSTIQDLLLKFANCQGRAEDWQDALQMPELNPLVQDEEPTRYTNLTRKWKALGIITDSYNEWGLDKGDEARDFLLERLLAPSVRTEDKIRLLAICQKTGNALAADRTTKFFPVTVAQGFFIGTVGIAFGRTEAAAAGPKPNTYINIEAHSIAFSAMYFWVIPAVFLASVIGVFQTENAIPRILRQFQTDITYAFPTWETGLPDDHFAKDDVEGRLNAALRERSGGIYSWQPQQPRTAVYSQVGPTDRNKANQTRGPNIWGRLCQLFVHFIRLKRDSPTLALIILASGTTTAFVISYFVPSIGFEARTATQLLLYAIWLFSAALDYILYGEHHQWRFWVTFAKDVVTTLATMGCVVITQVGIFNRCSSYTLWGKTGLNLPELTPVAGTLVHNIATLYPALAFSGVALQLLVFPGLIVVQYPHAARVFLQRDDNASNWWIWHQIKDHFTRKDEAFYKRWGTKAWEVVKQWGFYTRDAVGRRSRLQRKTSSFRPSLSVDQGNSVFGI